MEFFYIYTLNNPNDFHEENQTHYNYVNMETSKNYLTICAMQIIYLSSRNCQLAESHSDWRRVGIKPQWRRVDLKSYDRLKKTKKQKKTNPRGLNKLKQRLSKLLTEQLWEHVRLDNKHMLSLTIFLLTSQSNPGLLRCRRLSVWHRRPVWPITITVLIHVFCHSANRTKGKFETSVSSLQMFSFEPSCLLWNPLNLAGIWINISLGNCLDIKDTSSHIIFYHNPTCSKPYITGL